jgi:hypothetical protein
MFPPSVIVHVRRDSVTSASSPITRCIDATDLAQLCLGATGRLFHPSPARVGGDTYLPLDWLVYGITKNGAKQAVPDTFKMLMSGREGVPMCRFFVQRDAQVGNLKWVCLSAR